MNAFRARFWIAIFGLLLAACAPAPTPTATATPAFVTATLPPPTPTPTPFPPTPEPTSTPRVFSGVATYLVNVRAQPSPFGELLGVLAQGATVEILGQDPTGRWYQIRYRDGTAWVTADYIQTAATDMPVIGALPTAAPGQVSARVRERVNVRTGPGTNYEILGMLEPETAVALTGKNVTATWLQIAYPSGPQGRGWIMAAYLQTADVSTLPVLDPSGAPVAASTAEQAGVEVTPTPRAASPDGDSADWPGARVTLSLSGTRSFSYRSDLSTPTGDADDWLSLTVMTTSSTTARLLLSLECEGTDALQVEVSQGGAEHSGPTCGQPDLALELAAGQPALVHIALPPAQTPALTRYIFRARLLP